MTKNEELQAIYTDYARDPAFHRLRATATQLVRGEGVIDPDVVFIGEAPGREEDESGRPFVGAAGQMLTSLMRGIEMERAEIPNWWACYITNLVKYRPPGNRDPDLKEVADSARYLDRELEILQPKIVVTLGRYALMAVWPSAPSIRECHGWIRTLSENVLHMPMYHPAFGIYDKRNKDQLVRDFFLLRQELSRV